jgi:small subunit ribosomal protein S20
LNVAHSLSAKKRIRQSAKRRAHNRFRKELVKDQTKAFTTATAAGDFAKAETELRKLTARLDRVAVKGTIHRNAASRKRSRLTRKLNALKAAGPKSTAKGGTKAATA